MLKIQAELLGYPPRITLKVASGIDYIPLDHPNTSDFIPQKSSPSQALFEHEARTLVQ